MIPLEPANPAIRLVLQLRVYFLHLFVNFWVVLLVVILVQHPNLLVQGLSFVHLLALQVNHLNDVLGAVTTHGVVVLHLVLIRMELLAGPLHLRQLLVHGVAPL